MIPEIVNDNAGNIVGMDDELFMVRIKGYRVIAFVD